ncbi:UNVERIFIED_CONTAM: Ribonuclease HI [Sesamum radiatum]|uniref:Ribonuclease HI n=1 Tax=Sesamum radiatum TaxID=300843 RepID=A0AAW2U9C0_SESRA
MNVDDTPDRAPPSKKGKAPKGENSEETETPAKVQPAEELLNIEFIPGNLDKTTRISSHLGEAKKEITLCLQRNADIFAWTPQDLEGIDPQADEHVKDLEETFSVFRKYKLKLNPGKCAFQVQGGRFLGFMVTQRGIEANPLKIKAIIDMKLSSYLPQRDTSGRLVKWLELSEYDISYMPRTTIKAQALADFISEMAEITIKDESQGQRWLLHVDGSSTTQGSGAGIVITTPQGEDLEFAIKFEFKASNNEAEYEALVIGMRLANETGARHLPAYSDSQLVVKQVKGTYEAKEESMIQYLQQIADLKTKFHHFQIIKIPREENAKADSLSKLASSLEDCRTRHITIHYLLETRTLLAAQPITTGEDWRTPIIK